MADQIISPKPVPPPPSRDAAVAAAIKDSLAAEAGGTPPADPAPVGKVAETPSAGQPPAPAPVDGFTKLAAEKARLRLEAERRKPYEEILKAFSPEQLSAAARARAAGDKAGIMKALGLDEAPPASKEEPKPGQREADPEIAALKAQVAELRQVRQHEETRRMRGEVTAKISEVLKGKFPLVEGLGETERVLDRLQAVHAKNGALPFDTFEENVSAAAKEVEAELDAQKSRWSKVLTPAPASATVPEGTRESPSGQVSSGKTLTNSTSAPRAAVTEANSRDAQLKALVNDPNVPW